MYVQRNTPTVWQGFIPNVTRNNHRIIPLSIGTPGPQVVRERIRALNGYAVLLQINAGMKARKRFSARNPAGPYPHIATNRPFGGLALRIGWRTREVGPKQPRIENHLYIRFFLLGTITNTSSQYFETRDIIVHTEISRRGFTTAFSNLLHARTADPASVRIFFAMSAESRYPATQLFRRPLSVRKSAIPVVLSKQSTGIPYAIASIATFGNGSSLDESRSRSASSYATSMAAVSSIKKT